MDNSHVVINPDLVDFLPAEAQALLASFQSDEGVLYLDLGGPVSRNAVAALLGSLPSAMYFVDGSYVYLCPSVAYVGDQQSAYHRWDELLGLPF